MPAPVTRLPPPNRAFCARVAPRKQTRPLMSQISLCFPAVGLHWATAEQGATSRTSIPLFRGSLHHEISNLPSPWVTICRNSEQVRLHSSNRLRIRDEKFANWHLSID